MPEGKNYANKLLTPKFLVIYLIIAVVVYGLFYYFFVMAKKGGYKTDGQTNQTPIGTQEATTPTAKGLSVLLSTQNDSGQEGLVIFTEEGNKTKVNLTVSGSPKGTPQPAHIHLGDCPGVGDVKYPLTNVVNGESETTLDVTLDQLKRQLPLAVNVHKSATDSTIYAACGQIE